MFSFNCFHILILFLILFNLHLIKKYFRSGSDLSHIAADTFLEFLNSQKYLGFSRLLNRNISIISIEFCEIFHLNFALLIKLQNFSESFPTSTIKKSKITVLDIIAQKIFLPQASV